MRSEYPSHTRHALHRHHRCAHPSVTRSPALSNDLGHLVHLSLRTSECAESLLRQLPRALVLAVAKQFYDATLVWCEAIDKNESAF